MKYLVEAAASIERGNAIDAKGGPAPLFAYIAQRFKPDAIYGNPTRRQVLIIVDLPKETDVAELMLILAREAGTEPTFTPIMPAEAFDEPVANAAKAPRI